jgi:hypothetical protein
MKTHRSVGPGLLGCLLIAAAAAAAPSRLALMPAPGAGCPIVVAADASEAEQYAAGELAAVLGRMTGAAFAQTNAAPAEGPAIVLTFDPALGGEAYRLRADVRARRLHITGGRPRGVLYGVYGLLEDRLGCRWYTREVEKIPRVDALSVPARLDVRGAPPLEYREVYWREATDGDWAARNRLNSSSARLEARHGGKVAYGTFVHTFEKILPVEKNFEAHPEWFSMIDGKRVAGRTQLCLSNPEVLARAIAAVREWIRANPKATIFSVSQNDWRNPCACPACKAVDDAEGSPAGSLLKFVNAVAEAIGKDHPHVAIDTLAYQYTRKPPRTVKPLPNVIVRLCSIECCFSHPLDVCHEASNRSFMEDLRGWNKLTSRLYVWDYTTDFAHYLLPFPNLDSLDDNVRTFAAHGVVGIFEQGNSTGGGELGELRSWVLAKLLWDPSLTSEALIREFVDGVYGPAAPAVRRYLDLRRAAARRANNHVRIYDGFDRPDLAPDDLRAWNAALEEAECAAAGDAALASRIERLRMPVWYAQAMQGAGPQAAVAAASKRLAAAARAQKLTHFRESSKGIDRELAILDLAAMRRGVPIPAGVVRGDDNRFNLVRDGELTARVLDPAAEDGVAARLVGRTTEWAVSWRFGSRVPAGRYILRARIRVEKKSDQGIAFTAGVYDSGAKKSLGQIRIAAKDIPDGGYRDYDVATFDLAPGAYGWVAPANNEAAIAWIFIDRLDLVPVQG